jgi:hypothetical protein
VIGNRTELYTYMTFISLAYLECYSPWRGIHIKNWSHYNTWVHCSSSLLLTGESLQSAALFLAFFSSVKVRLGLNNKTGHDNFLHVISITPIQPFDAVKLLPVSLEKHNKLTVGRRQNYRSQSKRFLLKGKPNRQ